MTIRWTEAQNKCLIQLVKERTCLWLKSDPMHSSKKARDDSWLEIDQLLGTEGACRRFKSLRDDFTRWTKGTRKEYAYWEEMSFLKEQIGTRNRSRMKPCLPRKPLCVRNAALLIKSAETTARTEKATRNTPK